MITIVSGLPRSGTSMMMQMLAAGGMPILTDDKRQADEDNPRGYFEWETVTRLCKQPELIEEAECKAVKVISRLLQFLPTGHDYKVIFMRRHWSEMRRSQELMLLHRGQQSAPIPSLPAAIDRHLIEVDEDLHRRRIPTEYVYYSDVVRDPRETAERMMKFLGAWLYVKPMAAAVDPSLYRNRAQVTSVIR